MEIILLIVYKNESYSEGKWTWGYKYNHAGAREQKRLLTSPHGDGSYGAGVDYKIFAHLWEYYMTGAFGEEIVQYKGFQTAGTIDNDTERRVYLGAYRYRAGGELQIRHDGKKELNITDNNGSVRLVVIQKSTGFDTLHYDYKPFGDTLWTSAGTMNRDNFDGSTYDSESDLQMLGFRMYDNETGRFTTPDLLWSAFPTQTPYQYAYNSPLTYRDPTGLAPEKEKEGERLMSNELAECGSEILARQKNEVDNGAVADSPQPESSNGSRTAKDSSAPDPIGEGGSRRGGSGFMLQSNTDNALTSMFQSLLAQHLDVGLTDGLSLSGPPNMGSGSSHHRNTNLSPNPNDKGNKIIQKKSKMSDFDKWFSNVSTAFEMTLKWFTGIHGTTESNYFYNDIVANAMRNARRVNEARDFFYDKYKGKTDLEGASVIAFRGTFGLMGLFKAGLDPIEQFVGSCKINIYLHYDYLQFNIINRTSLTSALYHLWSNSWNWSQCPMGNYDQVFIFTEPINFKRLSGK